MISSKINFILLPFLFSAQALTASNFTIKKAYSNQIYNKPTEDYIKRIPDNSFYILGPGDELKLNVSDDTEELNKLIFINGEGIANLPRIKRTYAAGLTISELTDILNIEYAKYVIKPDVELIINKYRPVKVYIDGEVENPGYHILTGAIDTNPEIEEDEFEYFRLSSDPRRTKVESSLSKKGREFVLRNIYFPTLIDLIRKSGGVTINANLNNIKVTRKNSISNGGGRVGTDINLIKTLNLEDNTQNIRLYDGDTIYISKTEEPVLSQVAKALKSNINPKYISVYLSGRVENVGPIKVNKTSVLTDALDISGGVKVLKGPIRFIRYNNDGTVDSRTFRLARNVERGSYRNPYLKNGDVIHVKKSALNIANETIGEITSPLRGLLSSYLFFDLIQDKFSDN
tara:strand:- start:10200 stop:11402 length:1203 start_codon:yes stop_codon:yes gene_type:complete